MLFCSVQQNQETRTNFITQCSLSTNCTIFTHQKNDSNRQPKTSTNNPLVPGLNRSVLTRGPPQPTTNTSILLRLRTLLHPRRTHYRRVRLRPSIRFQRTGHHRRLPRMQHNLQLGHTETLPEQSGHSRYPRQNGR